MCVSKGPKHAALPGAGSPGEGEAAAKSRAHTCLSPASGSNLSSDAPRFTVEMKGNRQKCVLPSRRPSFLQTPSSLQARRPWNSPGPCWFVAPHGLPSGSQTGTYEREQQAATPLLNSASSKCLNPEKPTCHPRWVMAIKAPLPVSPGPPGNTHLPEHTHTLTSSFW